MKKRNNISQRGFSLIELMIVLVITAVLVTLAIARFGGAKNQVKRQNISRELKVNLERARFDSVKRRAVSAAEQAQVKIINATSYTVRTDLNQNGTAADASDTRTIDFSGQNGINLVGNNLVFPITITFDQYGRATATDGTTPTPQTITPIFTICNDVCTAANATSNTADVIYVSPSGTVAMLSGGASQPTFQDPTVTTVASTYNINPNVEVDP
ncbi:MAG: prepilin-type N-terminal cleavage/methylation domain-containing protein [Acidobacteriota bacterium]|nr:prepilin-type N-terminal cleavage/methylation domain-containing protein [Acidobacteriota bacterium]